MDKFEKRAVIKYLFLKGMSGKAIHDDMLTTLGVSALLYSVVKSWLPSSNVGETVSRMSIIRDAAPRVEVWYTSSLRPLRLGEE